MPRKIRELKADLRAVGFVTRPGKGSHTLWRHPLLPAEVIVISGNDGADARRYQERQVQDILSRLAALTEERQP